MLVVETIAKIRRAHFIDGKPIKQTCRELRVSRNTVRKVIRSGSTEFTYDRATQPRPKIDSWRSELDAMLAEKPGALRNGAPFKDWELPVAIRRVRRKLERQPGGDRQMVDILSAVLTDGIDAVEAACADPKQSIYAFRGADIDSYKQAKQAIARFGDDRIIHVGANFRCQPGIID